VSAGTPLRARGAGYLALAMLVLVLGGCGGSSGKGSTKGKASAGPTGVASTTQPTTTQPEPPCRRVPDEVVKRITKQLTSRIEVKDDVWQMVRASNVHELGLDNPYFVSARARVAPSPTTYGSWTVENLKTGAVIALDGTAKAGTSPEKGINFNAYEHLVNNHDYTQSRECAQAEYELKQEKRKG
jgi:hypothetical protein